MQATFTAAFDRDNTRLTYELLRGAQLSTATVVATTTADTNFWTRPQLSLTDPSPPAGNQSYRIRVKDPLGNQLISQTVVVNTAEQNLAIGKPATQVSTGWGGAPARAVDGNTDGNYNNGSVSHTDLATEAWWEVDLQNTASISSVKVFNRTDCCTDRINNSYLLVSDTPFTSTEPGRRPGAGRGQLLPDRQHQRLAHASRSTAPAATCGSSWPAATTCRWPRSR